MCRIMSVSSAVAASLPQAGLLIEATVYGVSGARIPDMSLKAITGRATNI